MTQATIALSRPGVLDGAERFAARRLARLRDRLVEYRDYNGTVSELRALNARQLADLGIAAHDIKTVARTATNRN